VKTESGARLINTVSERCKKARAHWDELTGMKVVNSELIISSRAHESCKSGVGSFEAAGAADFSGSSKGA